MRNPSFAKHFPVSKYQFKVTLTRTREGNCAKKKTKYYDKKSKEYIVVIIIKHDVKILNFPTLFNGKPLRFMKRLQ